jgi:ABC-2 type transport system permease protein
MLLVFTHLGRFNEGVRSYPVYLLMSVVLWTYFSQATEASVSTLVRKADFLRKLPFPPLALPLAHIAISFIDLLANLVVVFAFALIYGVVPRPGWLELIPIVAVLTIFATGFALFLSAAFVRHRDVDQVWGVVISAAFYATPIFYAASSVPGGLKRALVLFNPVATALTEARHAVIDPSAPSAAAVAGGYPWLLVPLGVVLVAVAAGFWMFGRESPWAAENV